MARKSRQPKTSSPGPARRSRSAPVPSLKALVKTLDDYQDVTWVRCGIPAIDLIIGDGIPRGRFIELIGDPSTAKSALGYVVIGAFQRAGGVAILIDSEAKTDKKFAEKMGVDFKELGYSEGATIKECMQLLGRVAQTADPKVPTVVVWDSIAQTPGSDELEKTLDDKDFTGEKAARARELSYTFRATMGELKKKQVTVLGINQLRTTFNFMGWTSTDSPGGKAVKYAAAVRLMMRTKGKIRNKEHDVITGSMIEVEAIKNQVSQPFRKAQMKFMFDTGFATYSGLDELLLRHGRLVQRAGWLAYKDKKFRPAELERIVAEIPDILLPIRGVIEDPPPEEPEAPKKPKVEKPKVKAKA